MPEERISILSLGAGVQSSTLALMAMHGEVVDEDGAPVPKPVAAVFADTGDESAATYAWLNWLECQLDYPVIRACVGQGLSHHIYDAIDNDKRMSVPPLFTSGISEREIKPKPSTGAMLFDDAEYAAPAKVITSGQEGILKRQCTGDFKIVPIRRTARQLMKQHGVKKVTQWIGISLDESVRMKPSRVKYSEHRWPLIEMRMSRHDCFRWMEAHGYPEPPRSACVYCPHHDNQEWRRIRDDEPDSWAKAVEFDTRVRHIRGVTQECYVHRQCVPLEQVDLSEDDSGLLWGNECEGMCGV
jgi:hypothetical protein